MKIFVSSLISGYEALRSAARSAITALRHVPTMAEDFGAQPTSPQIACLRGVREADLVVLILTDRYGAIPAGSTVSPTHEEFLEARDRKPLLVFVQEDVTREPLQAKLVTEVQGWQGGYFRNGFKTADELRDLITRAVHDHDLAHAAAPLNVQDLMSRAVALLPEEARRGQGIGAAALTTSFVGGPLQRILRPAELEAPALREAIQQEAMFGAVRVFDRTKAIDDDIENAALVIAQERGARIQLDEQGTIVLRLPLGDDKGRAGFGLSAIIEEDVTAKLKASIAFADWLLTKVDPTQRLVQLGMATSISGADGFFGWRTRAEHAASPNSGSVNLFMRDARRSAIVVNRHRAALRHEAQHLAEDLMIHLRRQHRQ